MNIRPELIADVTRWCDTATLLELATVVGAVERELVARGLPGARPLATAREVIVSEVERYRSAGIPEPMENRRAQAN